MEGVQICIPDAEEYCEAQTGVRHPEEMVLMVHKEPCPACKGNRYVAVRSAERASR